MKTTIMALIAACGISASAAAIDTSQYCTKAFNKWVRYEGIATTYVPTAYPTIYMCCGGGICQYLTLPKPGTCLMGHPTWSAQYPLDNVQGPNDCAAYGQGCSYGNICTFWRPAGSSITTACEGSRYPYPFTSIMRCSNPEP